MKHKKHPFFAPMMSQDEIDEWYDRHTTPAEKEAQSDDKWGCLMPSEDFGYGKKDKQNH